MTYVPLAIVGMVVAAICAAGLADSHATPKKWRLVFGVWAVVFGPFVVRLWLEALAS